MSQKEPRNVGVDPTAQRARAAEAEAAAVSDPEERTEALLDAAGEWSRAGRPDEAVRVHRELLAGAPLTDRQVERAYLISALFAAGQHDEARSEASVLRRARPAEPAVWHVVGEALECEGHTDEALRWYTAGITRTVTAARCGTPTVADVGAVPVADELFTARHRVRRALDMPHDAFDDVADDLHERYSDIPLDELHDPVERRRLEHDGDGALAELAGLGEVFTRQRGHRPVLFWPAAAFARLREHHPDAAAWYGPDHAAHLAAVEQRLRTLASDDDSARLVVIAGTLTRLQAFLAHSGMDAADQPAVFDRLAVELDAELRATGQTPTPWPPGRRDVCWCGSGRRYRKCHGV